MDWEYLFAKRIIERGYEYYYSNAVENLTVTNDTIQASVMVTEDYEVTINYDEDQIIDMECTCPYAQDGKNCKHMAAVLMEWENNYNNEDIKESGIEEISNSKEEVEELLNQASEQQIHDFMFNLLSSDKKICTSFKALVKQELSTSDIQSYKREINKSLHSYMYSDFIRYKEAEDFFSIMNGYVNNDFRKLMSLKQYKSVFELSLYLCDIVCSVDLDDSAGHTIEFIEECLYIWQEILENLNPELEDIMYESFIQRIDNEDYEFIEDHLIELVMNNFYEKKYLLDKFQFIQSKIEKTEVIDDWYAQYQMKKWISLLLRVMIDLDYSHEEIKRYSVKYWKIPDVRKYYVRECIRQENYEEAIRVLQASIKMDDDYAGLVNYYHVQLKDIYHTIGNNKAYKDELWYVVTHNVSNIEYYRELKSIYKEDEWESIRDKLFALLENNNDIDRLYIEEKMYDRLLLYVLNKSGTVALERHLDHLKDIYPKELLHKFRMELEIMAKYASNRSNYRRIVSTLSLMKRINGGDEVIQDIIDNWKDIYKRRTAMMDELRKL